MKKLFLFFALIFAAPLFAQYSSYALFTATADKTVANTTTETSILGTGVGSLSVPAKFFYPGRTITVSLRGYYSTAALLPSMTVKVYLGANVVCTASAGTLVASTSNKEFNLVFTITCRTSGASGTVMGQGDIRYITTLGGIAQDGLVNTATTTVDTTASNALDVKLTWGTASTSNSLTVTNVLIQAWN